MTYRIMACDGGGSLGTIGARVLARLSADRGYLNDQFDLYAGVSTGSLIAAALAHGIPAPEVLRLYTDRVPQLFAWSNKRTWVSRAAGAGMYGSGPLRDILDSLFGRRAISDSPRDLLITATQIWPDFGPIRFDEWPGTTVVTACLASCAAPTYLDPVYLSSCADPNNGTWAVDGGMSANDPSMLAVAVALAKGVPLESIRVLNLSCGQSQAFTPPNLIGWAKRVTSTLIGAGEDFVQAQCQVLLGDRYLSLDPVHDLEMDSTDTAAMLALGDQLYDSNRDRLLAWLSDDSAATSRAA